MTLLTEATIDEINAELAMRTASANAAEAQLTADAVQAFVDADAKLSAAAITATADSIDPVWVVLSFPADTPGQPLFWAGVVQQFGGTVLGSYQLRCNVGTAKASLSQVSALLP